MKLNDIWIADILKLSKRNEMYERLEESIMAITGRLTLPTDVDVIDETIRLKNLLGADALRDCDGTEMPEALLSEPVKRYATYYTTRKDNAWNT